MLSGVDGQPLANAEISVYEVLPLDPTDDKKDKNRQWRRWGTTDATGVIRFDLAGLGAGRTYILQADSPVDGSAKYSDELTATGHYTFVVGNEPLRVTVVNGITGLPLVDSEITVYEVLPGDDKWRWTTWSATDENGVAVFDLDGLGDGRVYVLDMNPYDAGGVQSGPISQPGDLVFRVGTVPITVIDGDNGVPLVGAHIDVYEVRETVPGDDDKKKDDDKKRVQLQWVKHADTDDERRHPVRSRRREPHDARRADRRPPLRVRGLEAVRRRKGVLQRHRHARGSGPLPHHPRRQLSARRDAAVALRVEPRRRRQRRPLGLQPERLRRRQCDGLRRRRHDHRSRRRNQHRSGDLQRADAALELHRHAEHDHARPDGRDRRARHRPGEQRNAW